MKNKKFWSLFVVMLMAFSIMPMAFAQEDETDPVEDMGDVVEDEVVEEVVVDETTEDETSEDTTDETTDETTEDTETTEDDSEETVESDETVDETDETVEDETTEEPEPEVISEEVDEDVVEEEEEVIEEIVEEDIEVGVTPDQPVLWGIERAIERIELALTFNKAKKAQKGLQHARERLLEVQQMIQEKKLKHAEKAQRAHDKILKDVEENIAELGNGDVESEFQEGIDVEKAINRHRTLVQKIGKNRLQLKGLTAEQEERAQALFESLSGAGEKVQIRIEVKKDKTRIKIKAARGMTDEQISVLEEQVRDIVGDSAEIRARIKKIKEKRVKIRAGDDEVEIEIEADDDEAEEDEEEVEAEIKVEDEDENETETEDSEDEEEESIEVEDGISRGSGNGIVSSDEE